MENGQEQKTLLTEMVEGLTNDVADLTKLIKDRPEPAAPPDLQPFLQRVADAINGLRDQLKESSKKKPPEPETPRESPQLLAELRAIRQAISQSPANRIGQAVQYGTVLLIASLFTTGIMAYYAVKWRDERDSFEVAHWKWRYTQQANPEYAAFAEDKFPGDSIKADLTQWVLEQESADQKREAARKAAEQAKVMNAQADELERKSGSKTGKK
jgi:hypothetical protein